jgi:hypothetical protein
MKYTHSVKILMHFIYIFFFYYETIGTAATPGLLCQFIYISTRTSNVNYNPTVTLDLYYCHLVSCL